MLVLSIGVLGIAGLEIIALKNTQAAYLQSVATVQIAAMFERLRVNHSITARTQECDNWNLQNQNLLPAGKGSCACDHNTCIVTLAWTKHQLTFQAQV